jgi:hypothetical protein
MTSEQLTAIRERCDAATNGPWELEQVTVPEENGPGVDITYPNIVMWRDHEGNVVSDLWNMSQEDADFIVNAHRDVPDLLDEVERLRGLLMDDVMSGPDAPP